MELNYDWDNYASVIDFLNNLYDNTVVSLIEKGYDIKYANEFINDIEDYLYYFKIHNYNLNNIIHKLEDIQVIEFYDSLIINNHNDNIKFPPVINKTIKILLNTNIQGDKRLSSRERRRLYLYQGLSHSLMSIKSKKTIEFSEIFSKYLRYNTSLTETIVNNGWLLIEDVLSQELAEKITYFALDKIRPQYRSGLENEEFPISGSKISSNLEMYRMFQSLLINFGLTLGKISNIYDYSEKTITNDLLKYAINNDLSYLIIAEYNEKNNLVPLYQILYLMGLLVNEMYRTYSINFIHNKPLSLEEVNQIYDNIIELTNSLISFDNDEYPNADITNIYLDRENKEKILRLVTYREI